VSAGLIADISIFVLSILVGFEVISKVPATLHTPLMSAANSIHGIVLIGVMITAAAAHSTVGYVLAFIAAAFAAMNVVGAIGHRPHAEYVPQASDTCRVRRGREGAPAMSTVQTIVAFCYLVAAAGFVLGLHLMNSPATARRGISSRRPAWRLPSPPPSSSWWTRARSPPPVGPYSVPGPSSCGGRIQGRGQRQDDGRAQLVSLFNAVGGGAAALIAIADFVRITSDVHGVMGRARSWPPCSTS